MLPTIYCGRIWQLLALIAATVVAGGCNSGPDTPDDLTEAQTALEHGEVEQARQKARAAGGDDADSPRIREFLAQTNRQKARDYEDEGQFQQARSAYLEAAHQEPSRSQRADDLAAAFEAGQQFGAADDEQFELVERLLDYRPGHGEFRRHAARLAEERSDWQAAADHYLWLFTADRSDIQAALRLGISYLSLDRPDDAIPVLEEAHRQQPDNVQVGLNLANAYEQLDRLDDAVELFENLVEHVPEHPGVLRRFARLKRQLGDEQRARRLEQRAIDASPTIEQRDEMRPLQ